MRAGRATTTQAWAAPPMAGFAPSTFGRFSDVHRGLADAQCQMDRFLPGAPACGGPIDLMVLHTVPEPHIEMYPGKLLHHPAKRE